MTKQDFLNRLSLRLEVLSRKEREDIIEEYSQHIDMKVQSGMSEEDAINDFGDIDALADEILEAYNLNTDYVKDKERRQSFEKKIADKVSGFAKTISKIADSISQKNGKQIFSIAMKFIILVVILLLLRIPVSVLIGLAAVLFAFLPGFMEAAITGIISVLINLIYLGVVCYSVYYFFRRIADEDTGVSDSEDFAEDIKREKVSYSENNNDWDNEESYRENGYKNEKREKRFFKVSHGKSAKKKKTIFIVKKEKERKRVKMV